MGDAGGGLVNDNASTGVEELFVQTRQRWHAAGFDTRSVEISGADIHVAEGGFGPPIALLHGYPQSGEIWRSIASRLARHYRVIIPDLPGMGLSAAPSGGYELVDIAEDIHHLLEALGAVGVEIIGHDWGAAVAAVYALIHRAEAKRLVFIESALAGAGFEESWNFADPNPAMTFVPLLLSGELTEQLLAGREEVFLNHLWRTFTANKHASPWDGWAPYVMAMERPGRVLSGANYYRAVYSGRARVRSLLAEGKLTIPVLSIAGAASLGARQLALVQAFADNIVEHVVIDNAGHFVIEEQPEAAWAKVQSFLGLDTSTNTST